jgi:hypothetical protein
MALVRIVTQDSVKAEHIVARVGVTAHNENIYASVLMDNERACKCYIYYIGRMYQELVCFIIDVADRCSRYNANSSD